jgi:hypothetical protein
MSAVGKRIGSVPSAAAVCPVSSARSLLGVEFLLVLLPQKDDVRLDGR